MTAQTATITPNLHPLAQTMRYANVLVDVAVTLGAMDVVPHALGIDTYTAERGAAFGVSVLIFPDDVVVVDTVATEIAGDWFPDDGETSNYTRVGMVRFGGELVRMRVFTGRPETTDGGAR
jgi:hypothetical protein